MLLQNWKLGWKDQRWTFLIWSIMSLRIWFWTVLLFQVGSDDFQMFLIGEHPSSPVTSHLLTYELQPNTRYSVSMLAASGMGNGEPSDDFTFRTANEKRRLYHNYYLRRIPRLYFILLTIHVQLFNVLSWWNLYMYSAFSCVHSFVNKMAESHTYTYKYRELRQRCPSNLCQTCYSTYKL